MTLLEKEFSVNFILVAFTASFLGLYASIGIAEQLRLSLIDERSVHGTEVRISRQKIHLLYIIICSFGLGTVSVWGSFYVSLYSLHLFDSDGTQYHLSIDSGVQILNFFLITIIVISALLISSYDDMFSKSKHTIINEFIIASKSLTMKEIRAITLRKLLITVATKRLHRVLVGGFLGGASVLTMIYIGMHGIEFDGHIHYDQGIIAFAVIVIMSSSFTGYWVFFRLLSIFPEFEWLRLSVAILGSITTSAGNYMVLYSARFYKDNSKMINYTGISPSSWSMNISFNIAYLVSTLLLLTITVYTAMSARYFVKRQREFLKHSEEVIFKLAFDFGLKLPPNRLPVHMQSNEQQLRQLNANFGDGYNESYNSSLSNNSTAVPLYTVYPTHNPQTIKLVEQYLATRCGPETWQQWQQLQQQPESARSGRSEHEQHSQISPENAESAEQNSTITNDGPTCPHMPPPPGHVPSIQDTELWKQRQEQVDMSFMQYLIHLGYLLVTGQFRKCWVAITVEFCPELPQSSPVSSSHHSSSSYRTSLFGGGNTMSMDRGNDKHNATLPTVLESGLSEIMDMDQVSHKNQSQRISQRRVSMGSRRVIPVESTFMEENAIQNSSSRLDNDFNNNNMNYSQPFPNMEIADKDRR